MPTVIAVVAMALGAAGCSSAVGSEYVGNDVPTVPVPTAKPSTKKPSAAPTAATDCTKSTRRLQAITAVDGIRLEAATDATRTSLLLKNTGNLAVIVVPDAKWNTRLLAAPFASPTDTATTTAMKAVANSGILSPQTQLPGNVPAAQAVIVPPGWAVCGLTDSATEVAGVRYLREKTASAEYFVLKALADQAAAVKTPAPQTFYAGLLRCGKATRLLLKERVDLQDIEFYAELLRTGSPCQLAFQTLVSGEAAAQRAMAQALSRLERVPDLQENTPLFEAQASS
ncbi:hypothetical protein E1263_06745 [Kribbella antibiotica]|uniref:DUF4439 domain-containing protein n=1 Tax=Kribbella antibiotica TaxID=190195 RepID=A0A4R4ZWP0_9ACTN|nr:hypothetical protein [Kribbella antibiotica]TDD61582.1 hypothetical protein E1263_06745 [Kribbella antibiotica]